MNDKERKAGKDDPWILSYHSTNNSIDDCKEYCLRSNVCVAVHYEYNNKYCFVYNQTTPLTDKDNATYSEKKCMDSQSW